MVESGSRRARLITVDRRDGHCLQSLPSHSALCDPLIYPLLFASGDSGWIQNKPAPSAAFECAHRAARLIHCVFDSAALRNPALLRHRAILTPRNDDALELNDTVLQLMDGDVMGYRSLDRAVTEDPLTRTTTLPSSSTHTRPLACHHTVCD